MEANINNTLVELKPQIEQLSVGDRARITKVVSGIIATRTAELSKREYKSQEAVHQICDRAQKFTCSRSSLS